MDAASIEDNVMNMKFLIEIGVIVNAIDSVS